MLPSRDHMMQSIQEFYQLKQCLGIPKHNTHDIANFEVKSIRLVLISLEYAFTFLLLLKMNYENLLEVYNFYKKNYVFFFFFFPQITKILLRAVV